jgi:hypothetical protein
MTQAISKFKRRNVPEHSSHVHSVCTHPPTAECVFELVPLGCIFVWRHVENAENITGVLQQPYRGTEWRPEGMQLLCSSRGWWRQHGRQSVHCSPHQDLVCRLQHGTVAACDTLIPAMSQVHTPKGTTCCLNLLGLLQSLYVCTTYSSMLQPISILKPIRLESVMT